MPKEFKRAVCSFETTSTEILTTKDVKYKVNNPLNVFFQQKIMRFLFCREFCVRLVQISEEVRVQICRENRVKNEVRN